jgi:DeoR/GlpR family transcriptional regulator of sugar metabolism
MGKALIPAERRQRIQDLLRSHHVVSSAALSGLLGASEATIRRDLEWLEAQGLLERTHGGAILSRSLSSEPPYVSSEQTHPDEKRWIGRAAASLVESGDTVFINSGTTAAEVLRHVWQRDDLERVTVVTNHVGAVLEAPDGRFEIMLLGGLFRPRSHSVVGVSAVESLRQVYASKCIIGVDGLSIRHHLTTPVGAEAEIAKVMIERTQGKVVIVADHSKWGVVSNFQVARLEQVHMLVVDEGMDSKAISELGTRSIRVITAGPDAGSEREWPPTAPGGGE